MFGGNQIPPKAMIGYRTLFLSFVISQYAEFYADMRFPNPLHSSDNRNIKYVSLKNNS